MNEGKWMNMSQLETPRLPELETPPTSPHLSPRHIGAGDVPAFPSDRGDVPAFRGVGNGRQPAIPETSPHFRGAERAIRATSPHPPPRPPVAGDVPAFSSTGATSPHFLAGDGLFP